MKVGPYQLQRIGERQYSWHGAEIHRIRETYMSNVEIHRVGNGASSRHQIRARTTCRKMWRIISLSRELWGFGKPQLGLQARTLRELCDKIYHLVPVAPLSYKFTLIGGVDALLGIYKGDYLMLAWTMGMIQRFATTPGARTPLPIWIDRDEFRSMIAIARDEAIELGYIKE